MTNQDVLARLNEIKSLKGDPEKQHHIQDQLMLDVLTDIAETCVDKRCKSLAGWALRVYDIRFPRWCA